MATPTIAASADAAAHAAQMRDMASALHQRAQASKISNTLYSGYSRAKTTVHAAAATVRSNPLVARVLAAASAVGALVANLFSIARPGNLVKAALLTQPGRTAVAAVARTGWSMLRTAGRMLTSLISRFGPPGRAVAGWLNGASGVATAAVEVAAGSVMDGVGKVLSRTVKDGRPTGTGWTVLTIAAVAGGLHLYATLAGVSAVAAIASNLSLAYLPGWAPLLSTVITALQSAGAVVALSAAANEFVGLLAPLTGITVEDLENATENASAAAPAAVGLMGYTVVVGLLQAFMTFRAARAGSTALLALTLAVAPGMVGVVRVALVAGGAALALIGVHRTVVSIAQATPVVVTEETVVTETVHVEPTPGDVPVA